MFVALFIPDAEQVWKQFKQLANAECFSTLRGGTVRLTDKKQLEPNQQRFLFFFRLTIKGASEEESKADLRLWSPLLWSCLLYIRVCESVSSLYCVMFKRNQEFSERLRGVQRDLAFKKQTTNLHSNNSLGGWTGGFSSVYDYVVPSALVCSLIKQIQSYEAYTGYCYW